MGSDLSTLIERFTPLIPDNLTGRDAIIFLIKNKIIDKRRIRNFFIKEDFNQMIKAQKHSLMYIYDDLSFKYDVSVELVRKITNDQYKHV